jgi:hypothetical protein
VALAATMPALSTASSGFTTRPAVASAATKTIAASRELRSRFA